MELGNVFILLYQEVLYGGPFPGHTFTVFTPSNLYVSFSKVKLLL